MILSDTIKVKYKIDTKGRNTVEMAVLPEDKAHNRKVMEGVINENQN